MAAEVHADVEPQARRVPMAWADYLALGEDERGEYVDGALLVSPRGTWRHQRVAMALARLLADAGFIAVQEWAWRPPGAQVEYQPDVMVLPSEPGDHEHFTAVAPLLVVEVTSPSNASKDWVRTMRAYARHGAGMYWIVEPATRMVFCFTLLDGEYQQVAAGSQQVRVPGWEGDLDVSVLWS